MNSFQNLICLSLIAFALILSIGSGLKSLYPFTFVFSIVLILIAVKGLINQVKTYYIGILGFGVMIFLDIASFKYIDPKVMNSGALLLTIVLSYLSFLFFLIFYNLPLKPFKLRATVNYQFSKRSFDRKITPVSILFLVVFTVLSILFPDQAKSPLFLLISFLPKATIVVYYYLYLKFKERKYIILFLLFLLLSFTEVSRRIYITLFFILFALTIDYIVYRKQRIPKKIKAFFLIFGALFFFFLNFLRADHNFGEGFEKNEPLKNTVNYIITLKSLDTFYNTAYIVDNFPGEYEFYYGETYSSVLFMFIPRAIWAEKPFSFSAPLGVLQKTGNRNFSLEEWHNINMYSLSPGFIGEAYANFGIIGVFALSIILGIVSKKLDLSFQGQNVFDNISYLPYFSWFAIFFLILRGDFYTALYYSIFYFLFIKYILKRSRIFI